MDNWAEKVLQLISERPGLTNRQISNILGISIVVVRAVVAVLVKRNLVVRGVGMGKTGESWPVGAGHAPGSLESMLANQNWGDANQFPTFKSFLDPNS
jgi:winged helix-turn-helix DNA-binding protein